MATVDVVVITALKEELDALLEVTAGLVEPWRDASAGDLPHHLATFEGEGQRGPIRVAAARTTQMASVATATVATRLVERLSPGCLAMCGVCAGHPDDTDLGDVVIADRVFHHDHGKLTSGGFQGDQWVHSLDDAWLRVAQDMKGPAKDLHGYAVADEEAGRWWLLEQLLAGRDPLRTPALMRRYVPDARRLVMLEALRRELGYVALTGKTLTLTDAGRDAAHEREVLYGTLVTERPYHVHVGPMGSGNYVVADGAIWKRLAENHGMRKALAVEMEAAAVGQVAHERSLSFVVVKGVMDHADEHKEDRFQAFAARASAEVLCAFLRRVVTATARPESGAAPSSSIDNRGAIIGQQIVIQGDASIGTITNHAPAQAHSPSRGAARPPTQPDVGEVSDQRLTEELARVIWEAEPARNVAIAAGFRPGSIPVMKTPGLFWERLVEDARNGAVLGQVKAVANAAAQAFPGNPFFAAYSRPRPDPAPPSSDVHGLELLLVPGGTFMMGSPDDDGLGREHERPRHPVVLAPFWLAKTPVTNAQYRRYMAANPKVKAPELWKDGYDRDEQPVVGVTWFEASEYCAWAGLRLPTEAQWEYACRAGTTTRYCTGDTDAGLKTVAWYSGNAGGELPNVAKLKPNAWGLHDMHGNVWEWCEDTYGTYETEPRPGDGLRHEPVGATTRVIRGGVFRGTARDVRSACRVRARPDRRDYFIGFRPARGPSSGAGAGSFPRQTPSLLAGSERGVLR